MAPPHIRRSTSEPAEILGDGFGLTLPDGRSFKVKRFTTRRRGGCRLKVYDNAGALLFDTNDCFDFANANAKLDDWLQAQQGLNTTPW